MTSAKFMNLSWPILDYIHTMYNDKIMDAETFAEIICLLSDIERNIINAEIINEQNKQEVAA